MTERQGLELDDDARDRLKFILQQQSTVAAGQIGLIGLDILQQRLGNNWPRYRDRVYEQTEKVLSSVLAPSEVFLRIGDNRYIVVFHNRDQAASSVICKKIVETVYAVFLGMPELQGLTLESVVLMLDPETVARSLGVKIAEGGSIPAPDEKAAGMWPAPVSSRHDGQLDVAVRDVCYIPVWDVRQGHIFAYKPTVLALDGPRRVSGYNALRNRDRPEDIAALDLVFLQAAAESLADSMKRSERVGMIVPVSFTTLSRRTSTVAYFTRCAEMPEAIRRQIIFEISHIAPGTPGWRAYEALATLKRFARGLFMVVNAAWRQAARVKDVPLLRDVPARVFVFDVEKDNRDASRVADDIRHFASLAAHHRSLLAVGGVSSQTLAHSARDAGARFIYGHYLASAVSRPGGAAALDWLATGLK